MSAVETTVAVTRRPVVALATCYVLAFVLPWAVWGTLIAEQRGWMGWHVPQSLAFWVGLPVAYLTAAVVSGGTSALRDLLSRLTRWRIGWGPYALALVLAIALPTVVVVVFRLAGAWIAPGDQLPLAQVPVSLLIEILLFWLTEEATWRGFVLPRIELWLAPGTAGLVVGVLWALWHLPLFAIVGSFQAGLPFAGFFLLTVATSVILSWLYHRGGGSVLLCALYHGVVDVTFVVTGVLTASPAAFWTVVALHILVAGVLWMRLLRLPRAAG